ncbi:GTP 3',8-cyclase MoaA [Pedobacter cryophilus]|uniref:Radical SAM protein n=1 Tax=Pedobacter cryophilus TaxID=2571271 RepID=A0A4U1BXV8_9SPHI|nr:GTP 3',8-cyclase MoaA [Pedobacter cryophilus]TKB97595.1 radical SAM protein [Pedobacter cryophilus]
MIVDQSKRTFKNLRISLLNSCNFACIYCTDDENGTFPLENKNLSLSELLEIVKNLHTTLGLESVRLTGGEPLLYPQLEELIQGLNTIGIPQIKMTTNAFLLGKKALALKTAGLQELNISLDAAEDAAFFKMTRRDKLQEVLNGIDAALAANIIIKLNAVIMKGKNDDQILPLLHLAQQKEITIRFLEVMAMGHLHQQKEQYLFSQQEILDLIASKYQFEPLNRKTSATANYWKTKEGFTFGIIANTSQPFCHDCNRLRLDQEGNIYGCLSSNKPVNIKNKPTEEAFNDALLEALSHKQQVSFTGSNLSMLQIGG